jgi:TLC domain.
MHTNTRILTDEELVATLHAKQDLSLEENPNETVSYLFILLVTAATIGTFHNIVRNILKSLFPNEYRNDKKNIQRIAYQFTNMIVNLILGIYGIYHYLEYLPDINSVPIIERISGFHEYSIFGALQVGYNLWALPIGAFFMNEPVSMLAHHVAVLCVGGISCFGRNGFRYHAPFFFGVIEISSVPLAMMNFCKNNRQLVDKHYPNLSLQLRIIFSIVFLVVRVIMWTPLMKDVLRSAALLGWTCRTNACVLGIGCFWLCAFFLTCLQYYWAMLILRGYMGLIKKGVQRVKTKSD